MVNEFERFIKVMNFDIFEVIKVVNIYKRVNFLYFGLGVGGFCIFNVFYYLDVKVQELGVEFKFLKIVRMFNEGIFYYIFDFVVKIIEKYKCLKKVVVFGIVMKDYFFDDRFSLVIEIIKIL